jgi:Iap family predicted aminopeptidase
LFTPALRGKVVVLVGPTPTRADLHRQLVRSQPAAVIHLDDRLPFEWVKDDGVYPSWVKRYGMPPTLAAPFRAGWEWRKQGATRARVRVRVELRPSLSQNVVADIPGREPGLPLVLLGAHHDTQCHNPGADDNASGVVALLELASELAGAKLLRTIRLVSFGAEEQLSVGSAAYVRRHRSALQGVGLVVNLDSIASFLGHYWLVRAGVNRCGAWIRSQLRRAGMDMVDHPAPMPFADHFPFSVFGIPALTIYRPNMDAGMRWQHHSEHDNLENVSAEELVRVAGAVGCLARALARKRSWPFARGLEPEHRSETARLARDLYGLRA